ncbi:MAG: alpha-ketoglutarate-dependent dioxygenase AlkB [Acidobacteria bacterium]|nr:alpha-ketoglutarate-dependent dioxygenase AlkB [Acidobacteriota bacterium]
MVEVWLYPGALHLLGFLSLEEQKGLLSLCRELARRPTGLYTPVLRTGARMSLSMMCLGRHWNAKTYRYEASRSDFDRQPVEPMPQGLRELSRRAAQAAGFTIESDICIVNFYGEGAKLGLHQDKDETPQALAAGIPVVSLSVGDAARFRVGGFRRQDPTREILLSSGDAFVMGGESRLRYHGVPAVLPGTAPAALDFQGRFNLTFRQYALRDSGG